MTHVILFDDLFRSLSTDSVAHLLRVYVGLEVYIVTEEGLKINLISHSNIGLCNLWIIRYAAFATCFVLTCCSSFGKFDLFLNLKLCHFLGHLSFVWFDSTSSPIFKAGPCGLFSMQDNGYTFLLLLFLRLSKKKLHFKTYFLIPFFSSAFHHPHFPIHIFPSSFSHPRFPIRIFPSAFYYPPSAVRHQPSAAIRSAFYRDPKFCETRIFWRTICHPFFNYHRPLQMRTYDLFTRDKLQSKPPVSGILGTRKSGRLREVSAYGRLKM